YDLLTRAFDLAEDDAERRRILFLRGDMLAKTGEFARADKELTDLMPDVAGREEVETLLSLAMATHWTEQTERTLEVSQRALTLSRDEGLRDLEPIAMSLLSAGHSMRGDAGDIARALELGEQATALWPKGERQPEYAHHIHILGNPLYWSGRYQEA